MNLLLLTSSFPAHPDDAYAAAGLFIADLARVLAEDGHHVVVATPDKLGEKAEWPGFTVDWLPWPGGDKPLAQINMADPREWPGLATLIWRTPRQLEALCRREHIEAVIALWALPAGWWARHLKRQLGLPIATWCLGSDIHTLGRMPGFRSIIRTVLRASDVLCADGLQLAREAEQLSGCACTFIPSCRPLDPGLARPLDPGTRRPLFVFFGRYAAVKGPDVLLEAMGIYVRRGGSGALMMHGGGPLDGALRARATQDDLRERVHLGGFAGRETVVSYLAACDVAVIPSRRESIPLAYSEALQMGRALIVSDVGDMGDLLRRHGAGLVVPPEDAAALAAAMLAMDGGGAQRYHAASLAAAGEFDLRASARELVRALEAAGKMKTFVAG